MIGYKNVALRLREMILRGELAPGERLAEVALAERLGVSRTPIRQALPALAREGLLAAAGRRGYVVRSFSPQDVIDAIETRGLLEGLAARRIAERGAYCTSSWRSCRELPCARAMRCLPGGASRAPTSSATAR